MRNTFLWRLRGRDPVSPERGAAVDHRTQSNRRLAHRLYLTFERDLELARLHGIHFYVQNGSVTLYGVVRHELDRELLTTLVGQIEGVTNVIDQLQIVDPQFRPSVAHPTSKA